MDADNVLAADGGRGERQRGRAAGGTEGERSIHRFRGRCPRSAHPLGRGQLPASPSARCRRSGRPPDAIRPRTARTTDAWEPHDPQRPARLGRCCAPISPRAPRLPAGCDRRDLRAGDGPGGAQLPGGPRAGSGRPRGPGHPGLSPQPFDVAFALAVTVAHWPRALPAPGGRADQQRLRRAPRPRPAPSLRHRLQSLEWHAGRGRWGGGDRVRGPKPGGLRQPRGGPPPPRLHQLVRAPFGHHHLCRPDRQRGHADRPGRYDRKLHRPSPALRGAPLGHADRPDALPAGGGGLASRRRLFHLLRRGAGGQLPPRADR